MYVAPYYVYAIIILVFLDLIFILSCYILNVMVSGVMYLAWNWYFRFFLQLLYEKVLMLQLRR